MSRRTTRRRAFKDFAYVATLGIFVPRRLAAQGLTLHDPSFVVAITAPPAGGAVCTTPGDAFGNPNIFYGDSSLGGWLGSEYTATAKTNCTAEVYIRRIGSPTGSFALRIYNASGASPGAQLGDESDLYACSAVPLTTPGYFSMSGFSATTTAATHWVVLRFTDISNHDGLNNIGWALSNDAGTAGAKYSSNGTSWSLVDDTPMVFRLFTA